MSKKRFVSDFAAARPRVVFVLVSGAKNDIPTELSFYLIAHFKG
jgi:hypothetical protein